MKYLTHCAFFLLSLPTIIFCIFWCNWWVSLPLSLLIFATCLSVSSDSNTIGNDNFVLKPRDYYTIGAAFIIIILSQYLVGYTGTFAQHSDFASRNAMFGTICREEWPIKAANGVPMVYYIGGFLPAAMASKLLGLDCRNHLFLYQNIFILFTAYLLVCVRLRRITLSPILAAAILGSIPSVFGITVDRFFGACWVQEWYFGCPASIPVWPEVWSQLANTVNHGAYSLLAGSLCCLQYRNKMTYALVGALLLIVSPISVIALSPLVLYKIMQAFRSKEGIKLKDFTLIVSVSIVIVTFTFLTQISTYGAEIKLLFIEMMHYRCIDNVHILISYIGTGSLLLFMFGVGKNREFWVIFTSFMLLPIFSYGHNFNEIMLKGPAPLWVFFCLYFSQLIGKAKQIVTRVTALFLIGLFCLRILKALPGCIAQFGDCEHNVCDPYGSDYFSPEATEAKKVIHGYRVFPMSDEHSMEPEDCKPLIPFILK